jgi:DNA polymerase-3 subunit delta
MAELQYRELLANHDRVRLSGEQLRLPVYLIFGEEVLVRDVFESLLDGLLPKGRRGLSYEPLDGTTDTVADVLEHISTYPLVPGTKVVALKDARVFYGKQDGGKLLKRSRKAMADQDVDAAASHLLALMGHLGLKSDDIDLEQPRLAFDSIWDGDDDGRWLTEVVQHCRDNRLSPPADSDEAALLQRVIQKGFAPRNVLILTTDTVDKRRGLYRTIREAGMIVDCSVPGGDRKADRQAQAEVLFRQAEAILQRARKNIEPDALDALCAKTGFDLRTFTHNLEKLIDYIGDGSSIRAEDVEAVAERTRTDPIYELTNAIAERRTARALFFLQSLLAGEIHPLQALSAIANQIRRLAVARDFIDSEYGRCWDPRAPFHHFRKTVIPAAADFDRHLREALEPWPAELGGLSKTEPPTGSKATARLPDLRLVRNPQNAYPIYLLLKNAERFTKDKLRSALQDVHQADQQMKTSPLSPQLILERIVFRLCGHGEDV